MGYTFSQFFGSMQAGRHDVKELKDVKEGRKEEEVLWYSRAKHHTQLLWSPEFSSKKARFERELIGMLRDRVRSAQRQLVSGCIFSDRGRIECETFSIINLIVWADLKLFYYEVYRGKFQYVWFNWLARTWVILVRPLGYLSDLESRKPLSRV